MNGQSGGFSNPVFGGNVLIRPAVKSPNYQAGVSGWQIARDGSAEFNNLTLRGVFVGTDYIANSNGIFVYAGTPAHGNLTASIAALSGTDQFGNPYIAGVVSYDNSLGYTAMTSSSLLFGAVADGTSKAGGVALVGLDGVALSSPITTSEPDSSVYWPVAGNLSTTPQSAAAYPHAQILGTQWLNGAMVYAAAPGNVWTAETWHTPTFSGTWSSTGTLNGNSTFRGMQYRRDAEDNVWILGGATTTGAGGSIFTLPSGYFNASRRSLVPCWILHAGAVSSAFAQVTEAGVVNIASTLAGVTIAAGDQVFINGKFPLGNVA